MRKQLVIALALSVGLLTNSPMLDAQQVTKRPLTLQEYTMGSLNCIYPEHIYGLQWLDNQLLSISYPDNELKIRGIKDTEWKTFLTLDTLKAIINSNRKAPIELDSFPYAYQALPNSLIRFDIRGEIIVIDTKSNKVVSTMGSIGESQARLLSPNYKHLAYVKGHNLFITDPSGNSKQLTQDGSIKIVYGQSVHQNEFGIHSGLFWSPDGTKLAFYRMDQSMVSPYPILHVNAGRPYGEEQYYPMAGTALHHVKLGIYDLTTGKLIYLDTPDASKTYLTNIAWTPDNKEILIAEVNREQTEVQLRAYSSETGEALRTILTEHNDKYIEPQHPVLFLPNKPTEFIWQSRRNGYHHLYHYNLNGRLIKQVTQGNWEVTDVHGFSSDGKDVFYSSTQVSPLERHLYRVSLSGKSNPLQLTSDAGWHRINFSEDKKTFIDTYESINVGNTIKLKSSTKGGKSITTLLEVSNPDEHYLTPQIELGTIKAADGKTDLHYRLIRPYNFDATKKYPTIIYVYNGPHAQLVQNRYRGAAGGWELNMANQGYVIFTVDGRGSAHRGAAFEQVIHRQLGTHEMADQLQGVEFLKTLPYTDMSRLGVYGWSFGGFMTTNLMLSYPDIFKVGVAGGPVIDWSRYEIMYGERYMDTPQENPKGYEANNLLLKANKLKGRLMLIHGTIDPVVIWQHSLLFLKTSVTAGTHPDYMVYPEHQHNVLGSERVHLNEVITRYFKDHL